MSGLVGAEGAIVVVAYLCVVVGIGAAARWSRREDSLSDFYLSGRRMNLLVLFLTLYATQYSGLTLIGFAGNAYRTGFSFLVAVSFGCSIVGSYLIIAPGLHALSKKRGYVTIGDFVHDRFESPVLTGVASFIFVFALAAYVLSNLKAIGFVVDTATGGRVSFAQGVIGLSLLMVAYETWGGMRAVAWTDVLQGIILMVACVCIFLAIMQHYGSLAESTTMLRQEQRQLWNAPALGGKLGWLSTLVLVSSGVAIYPHAVQRIYAARDARVLRRSMQLMLLMPFLTTLPVLLVGIIGAARFPGLDTFDSERIVLIVLQDLVGAWPALRVLVVLLLCAVVAAIMSTVDSALLAISSLVTQDLYARVRPAADQKTLTRFGKGVSWLLMALLAYLAIELPHTLWRITEIKLEVLCQMAPAVFFGLHVKRLRGRAVLAGVLGGTALTMLLSFGDLWGSPLGPRPAGVHAGVWGLLLNVAVVTGTTRVRNRARPRPALGVTGTS